MLEDGRRAKRRGLEVSHHSRDQAPCDSAAPGRIAQDQFRRRTYKCAIIVEAVDSEGRTGWGETALKTKPSYGAETILTALHITRDFLIPKLLGQTLDSPTRRRNASSPSAAIITRAPVSKRRSGT